MSVHKELLFALTGKFTHLLLSNEEIDDQRGSINDLGSIKQPN